MSTQVLVVAQSAWAAGLKNVLEQAGLRSCQVKTALKALNAFSSEKHNLVLFEIDSPTSERLILLKAISEISAVPIVVARSHGARILTEDLLNMGADHVILAPPPAEELIAVLRASLRRSKVSSTVAPASKPARSTKLTVREACDTVTGKDETNKSFKLVRGGLRLDALSSSVSMGGREVALTSPECKILRLLMLNERKCVGRDQILELLHSTAGPSNTRLPQVYMSRLRLKLRHLCGDDEPIANIKGNGWVFRAPSPRNQGVSNLAGDHRLSFP